MIAIAFRDSVEIYARSNGFRIRNAIWPGYQAGIFGCHSRFIEQTNVIPQEQLTVLFPSNFFECGILALQLAAKKPQ